ncbi:MAG: class I SAM-dependent methyltransferase [Caulobacteraceae bacterium]|nr:class I SAM-dependent methyltransferase [Caulobacteraceae bacterium]
MAKVAKLPKVSEPPIARAHRIVTDANVEGWLGGNIHHIVAFIDGLHATQGLTGDIAEIGIHHGRLFFVLAAAARGDESCFAIDLFDHQELNVDSSGQGSKDTFLAHAENLFPELLPRLRLLAGDSMGLTLTYLRERIPTKGIRIFSIDGGHTSIHAINDLIIAQELLLGGGLVLLDDYFGPHWPGVTEGFFKFMSEHNRRLAPLLIFENKLFLTTFSEHSQILGAAEVYLRNLFGEAFDIRWKYTEVCGFRALSFG